MGQVGIFRKSGVKSRIQNLRQMNETSPDNVCYEGQSAYDVADLLKQYFRDLPEPIFTSKLTTTFLQIYQRESPALVPSNLPHSQSLQILGLVKAKPGVSKSSHIHELIGRFAIQSWKGPWREIMFYSPNPLYGKID